MLKYPFTPDMDDQSDAYADSMNEQDLIRERFCADYPDYGQLLRDGKCDDILDEIAARNNRAGFTYEDRKECYDRVTASCPEERIMKPRKTFDEMVAENRKAVDYCEKEYPDYNNVVSEDLENEVCDHPDYDDLSNTQYYDRCYFIGKQRLANRCPV